MPEYLYGETLRWSFGFENPNKTAVIFACLLPLCWLAWSASWQIERLWLRVLALLCAGLIFLGAGGCLLMTFSRGGLVAALAAMSYLWIHQLRSGSWRWKNGRWNELQKRPSFWFSMLLILALIGVALWCGLAERATSGVVGDASVSHRSLLWKGALQMAHDNPAGFEKGRSGEEYIQWYQPPERTEGYRTMVNSYLTFLVERGWMAFGCCVFLLAAFWCWSAPSVDQQPRRREISAALRASLLAFLVAGIFSTTMENLWLWIIPSLCVLSLVVLRLSTKSDLEWKGILCRSLGITALVLMPLWGLGWYFSLGDSLIRTCGTSEGKRSVVTISPRSPSFSIGVFPDPEVMGNRYGKLLQTLALRAKVKVTLDKNTPVDLLIATGRRCFESSSLGAKEIIWIAPPIPTDEEVVRLQKTTNSVLLLIPDIDEDGRSNWWNHHAIPNTKLIPLQGVGTRIDWAWDTVIETVSKYYPRRGRFLGTD